MRRLLPIVPLLLSLVAVSTGAQETRWRELQSQAQSSLEKRNYKEGLSKAQKALQVAEHTFGAEHPNVAVSLHVFAELHRGQKTCREARPLHERALAIREKVLGPEHPDVAQSLDALAWTNLCLARFFNKFYGAASLHKRALAIWEKSLGQDDAFMAARLYDLAYAYVADFGLAAHAGEAEAAYQRSLAIQEKLAKPEPTLLINTLNGLARVSLYDHRQPERVNQGLALHQRALEIRERMPNPDLGALAEEIDSLASLYRKLKRYSEAEPLFLQELATREQLPGRRGLAESCSRVGSFYQEWGKLEKAEPLYKRAIEIIKAEGADPTRMAEVLDLYGILLSKLQRPKEAQEMLGRARGIRQDLEDREMEPVYVAAEKELSKVRLEDIGLEHGETAAFLMLYVEFLRNTQRAGKAAKLEVRLQKVMAQAELVHEFSEQVRRAKEMLELAEKQCGAEHLAVARYLEEYSAILRKISHVAEAKQAEQRAKRIRSKRPQNLPVKPCELERPGDTVNL